jgi:hypothetical protein
MGWSVFRAASLSVREMRGQFAVAIALEFKVFQPTFISAFPT